MRRAKPPRPVIHRKRERVGNTPRILIISEDAQFGEWVRAEMRRLIRDWWFVAYETIGEYRESTDGNIIHDAIIYCPLRHETPDEVKENIGRILFISRESKIILYSACNEHPTDDRIRELVERDNEEALAKAVRNVLRPEAA